MIYFTDIVKHISVNTDKYGQKTETVGPEIPARVVEEIELIRDESGNEITSSGRVYLKSTVDPKFGDKIQIIRVGGAGLKETGKTFIIKKKKIVHNPSVQFTKVWV